MIFRKIVFILIICFLFILLNSLSQGYLSIEDKVKIWLYSFDDSVQAQVLEVEAGVPVLLYHGIVKEADGINITWQNFIDQMESLKRAGYQTINTDQLARFLKGEDINVQKPVMITFDDARKDSYYYSDFVLKELDFQAVMFVSVNKQVNEDDFFLSWKELNKMQRVNGISSLMVT